MIRGGSRIFEGGGGSILDTSKKGGPRGGPKGGGSGPPGAPPGSATDDVAEYWMIILEMRPYEHDAKFRTNSSVPRI